jgi:hypothetical protein
MIILPTTIHGDCHVKPLSSRQSASKRQLTRNQNASLFLTETTKYNSRALQAQRKLVKFNRIATKIRFEHSIFLSGCMILQAEVFANFVLSTQVQTVTDKQMVSFHIGEFSDTFKSLGVDPTARRNAADNAYHRLVLEHWKEWL